MDGGVSGQSHLGGRCATITRLLILAVSLKLPRRAIAAIRVKNGIEPRVERRAKHRHQHLNPPPEIA